MMENRVTGNGYWKQLDVEEPIFNGAGKKVGLKTFLVFFIGEDPAGIETNWVMQEYQLCSSATATSDYKRKANRKLVSPIYFYLFSINGLTTLSNH